MTNTNGSQATPKGWQMALLTAAMFAGFAIGALAPLVVIWRIDGVSPWEFKPQWVPLFLLIIGGVVGTYVAVALCPKAWKPKW